MGFSGFITGIAKFLRIFRLTAYLSITELSRVANAARLSTTVLKRRLVREGWPV